MRYGSGMYALIWTKRINCSLKVPFDDTFFMSRSVGVRIYLSVLFLRSLEVEQIKLGGCQSAHDLRVTIFLITNSCHMGCFISHLSSSERISTLF